MQQQSLNVQLPSLDVTGGPGPFVRINFLIEEQDLLCPALRARNRNQT